MTEPIKPALTPEQWSAASTRVVFKKGAGGEYGMEMNDTQYAAVQATGERIDPPSLWIFDDSWAVPLPASVRHSVAALCLHGHPFGFTHEDVALLEHIASGCDGTKRACDDDAVYADGVDLTMRDVRRLMSLASRIAALLPPEAS